jgi:hypothetical protein
MDSGLSKAGVLVASSPWRNAYWFARMLLNGDKYGGVGVSKERQMLALASKLESLLAHSSLSKQLSTTQSEFDENILLTAFVQEFERRLGQKRKSRAGTSLEDVMTFLFDRYQLRSHPKPDRFQTDIEVDKWFKCKDGWIIGISCKRTLRERWKQVSSADSHALSRYKVKGIWHVITFDKDLSDEKITMLGQQRQVFYLDAGNERYKTASNHVGMAAYVRPLSQFISDVRREQNG